MSYSIEIEQQPRQPYVAVRTTVPMAEIGQHMGQVFGQLFGWLGMHQVTPIGPPWARYLAVGPDEVEFEVGVPVAAPVEASGPVTTGVRPATTVAKTLHVGPYDTLEGAYTAVMEWLGANGRLVTGAMWEVYESDPEQEPDPAKWRCTSRSDRAAYVPAGPTNVISRPRAESPSECSSSSVFQAITLPPTMSR